MNIGEALSSVRLTVSDLIGQCWAPGFSELQKQWPVVEGGDKPATLTLNIIHYENVVDWIFFKSNIMAPTPELAMIKLLKRVKKGAVIRGGYEDGVDATTAFKALAAGMLRAQKSFPALKFSYALNSGIGSEHVYVQVDHPKVIDEETTVNDRLVFILVLKSDEV